MIRPLNTIGIESRPLGLYLRDHAMPDESGLVEYGIISVAVNRTAGIILGVQQ
jgi:hypothetical protein